MESWSRSDWSIPWGKVPRDSGLVGQLSKNLLDDKPLPLELEYPGLNEAASQDLTITSSHKTPSGLFSFASTLGPSPFIPRKRVSPAKYEVTSTTNVRPESSSNVPGARLWDPAETKPRSLMIIIGSDHDGFKGRGYDWFKRNGQKTKRALVRAYKDKGLDVANVQMVWRPTPEKVKAGFESLQKFAEANKGKDPQTMVYVIGHGHIIGREEGIPKEEEFRAGSGIWEVGLNSDKNYDVTDSQWKQYFADYLDGYEQKVFMSFSCMAGGSVAANQMPLSTMVA
jgi:hypothetical protein